MSKEISEIIIKITVKDDEYHEPLDFIEQIKNSLEFSNSHSDRFNSLYFDSLKVEKVNIKQ